MAPKVNRHLLETFQNLYGPADVDKLKVRLALEAREMLEAGDLATEYMLVRLQALLARLAELAPREAALIPDLSRPTREVLFAVAGPAGELAS